MYLLAGNNCEAAQNDRNTGLVAALRDTAGEREDCEVIWAIIRLSPKHYLTFWPTYTG